MLKKLTNQEREAINDLNIPTLSKAYKYTTKIKDIIGVDVVVAPLNSFSAWGYGSNRPFIGYGKTANGKTFGIWYSDTYKQLKNNN